MSAEKEKLDKVKEALDLSEQQLATLKEISKMTAEEVAARKDLVDANVQNNMLMAEMYANIGQVAEAAKLRLEAEKELGTLQALHMEAINNGKDMEASISEKILAIKEAEKNLDDDAVSKLEEELEKLREKKKIHEENRDVLEQHVNNLEQRVNSLKDVTKEYDNLSVAGKKIYEDSHKAFAQIGVLGFGIVKMQDTMVGKSMMFAKTLMDARKGADGLKLAFKETFNVANIGASLAQKVVESFMFMFTAVDKAGASFAAATGTGREYVSMLEDGVKAGNHLGVNFDNMGKSLKGLLENVIGFTHMSKEMQQSLSVQVAQFERLGIASTDAADLMNTFTTIMGQSAEEAVNLTRELSQMGSSIGISSNVMIKNFQKAQGTLAVYGKGAIKVFTNLSAAAKASGVELTTLLGIAGKFDTFESAADSVGKLNAILGANMSATQVLMQTEDERIETIIQSINMSGESFQQMDRFKQKAIANAAGITDMAEANKIFGMSMSQYRQYSTEMKNAETSQEKFQEMVKATVPIQEMFQQMIIEFAPKVTPLLETVRTVLQGVIGTLHSLNEFFGGMFPYMILTVGVGMMAYKLFAGAVAVATTVQKAKAIMDGTAAAASEADAMAKMKQQIAQQKQTITQLQSNAATSSGIGPMIAFGIAVAAVGFGIKMAADGLANFVNAFSNLNAQQLEAVNTALVYFGVALLGLVAALLIVAYVGTAATLPMLALGAAILLIGVGIGIAAAGMALMAVALTGLVVAITAMGEHGLMAALAFQQIAFGLLMITGMGFATMLALYFLSKALASAGVSSMAMGVGMLFSGIGLAVVGALLPFVVEQIGKLATDSLVAAANFGILAAGIGLMAAGLAALTFVAMSSFGVGAIVALGMLQGVMYIIKKGIEDIDTTKLENLGSIMEGVGAMLATPVQVTMIAKVNEDLKQLKQTMDASLQSQIASLNTFQNVEAINTVRAQTKSDTQIIIKPSDVQMTIKTTTEVDGDQFTEATHSALKKINWNTSNVAGAIVTQGKASIVG